MVEIARNLTYEGIPVWRHERIIRWALQIVSAVFVLTLAVWFIANVIGEIDERDIPFGFTFLDREYQTPIGEHFLPYESSDSFGYALIVAVTNTLFVSVLGVIFATILGIAIGVARLSGNWLVSRFALVYIEFFRNVPLLVQLLFWFFIVLALPNVRNGYNFWNAVYVNNSGVSFPGPVISGAVPMLAWLAFAAVAVLAGWYVDKILTRREETLGQASYPLTLGIATAVAIGAFGWLAVSAMADAAPLTLSSPEAQGRFGRIAGGITVRSGLLVILIGLVIYTASFIAEIVRAGIQSVTRGQVEAARALGLTPMSALRHVTFPQALRVIVPPLISQYLNLTKNSSLGGAVGYTELTNVGITMTQTAPAISIFLLIMLAYLLMSLTYSAIGNLYNRYISFGDR